MYWKYYGTLAALNLQLDNFFGCFVHFLSFLQ